MLAEILQQPNILYGFAALQDSFLDQLCTFVSHGLIVHACGGGAVWPPVRLVLLMKSAGKLVYLQENLECFHPGVKSGLYSSIRVFYWFLLPWLGNGLPDLNR